MIPCLYNTIQKPAWKTRTISTTSPHDIVSPSSSKPNRRKYFLKMKFVIKNGVLWTWASYFENPLSVHEPEAGQRQDGIAIPVLTRTVYHRICQKVHERQNVDHLVDCQRKVFLYIKHPTKIYWGSFLFASINGAKRNGRAGRKGKRLVTLGSSEGREWYHWVVGETQTTQVI